MNDDTLDYKDLHREMAELSETFHETKHKVKNSLAIILAMAELSQRNPNYSTKLVSSVVGKTPEMVELLEEFARQLKHLTDRVDALAEV